MYDFRIVRVKSEADFDGMSSEAKRLIFVTHPDKHSGPNPGLTDKGKADIAKLRSWIPNNPSAIICGTGRRHRETAEALGIQPTNYNPLVGDPSSLDKEEGEMVVYLADGTKIPHKMTSLPTEYSIFPFLALLENDTIVVAGRPLMLALGGGKSCSVYQILLDTKLHDGMIFMYISIIAEEGVAGAGKDER